MWGDTALGLQLKDATQILLRRLDSLIAKVSQQASKYKKQIMIGRTHGIHGEPTTLGLKLALFYAELTRSRRRLIEAQKESAVGKLSGAVGTFSNIDPDIENEVCEELGLSPDPISTQVIGRDRHAYYSCVLGTAGGKPRAYGPRGSSFTENRRA